MSRSNITYLAPPSLDSSSAQQLVSQKQLAGAYKIGRRGYQLGWIAEAKSDDIATDIDTSQIQQQWQSMRAIHLPGFFKNSLTAFEKNISQAQKLSEAVLNGQSCDELFSEPPYAGNLQPKFELLAVSCDESDPQEIETIDFDVMDTDNIIAEGLWVKASWLSFDEEDISLRFRFSFGIVGYEDVAADYLRQQYAAELTEAIFPQSKIISQNEKLQQLLCQTLNIDRVDYVERIIYFNAPQGGAQFHQDVERGHLGVVFAQIYGRTAWLALSKAELIEEILIYINSENAQADYLSIVADSSAWETLVEVSQNVQRLNSYLDDTDNDAVEYLINRVPRFCQQLLDKGYGFILNPGDGILLPQQTHDACCWHSVFCIDDYPGQALSFAIRGKAR